MFTEMTESAGHPGRARTLRIGPDNLEDGAAQVAASREVLQGGTLTTNQGPLIELDEQLNPPAE